MQVRDGVTEHWRAMRLLTTIVGGMANNPTQSSLQRGAVYGLLAAALFGVSAPLAKRLLADIEPVVLAGLLYLGAAAGLWAYSLLRPSKIEAPLQWGDRIPVLGVVLLGGVAGPILMLFGLQRVTGLTGSLLLNLEAPFTVVVAALVFREHVGRYAIAAVVLIVGGAAVLRVEPGQFAADPLGIGLLGAACLAWALDNNLTQRLSLRDPLAIVRVKTLAAGTINLLLGLVISREGLPALAWCLAAMLLGVCSYGVSVVLDAYALRLVGAAREAAYFASAPFMGALASIVIFHNSLSGYAIAAMAVMATGVALLLREKHGHEHEHLVMSHEHAHTHDEHHQHTHSHAQPPLPGQPHSHAHHHTPLRHHHRHAPDVHHRHKH